MKRSYLIIIATIFSLTSSNSLKSSSQTLITFGNFPPSYSDTSYLKTSDLLETINWRALKKFCDTAKGHYVYESKDSLLTTFSYIKQSYEASFEIISYKGFVVEFYSDLPNSSKPTTSSYFDKKLWLQYVNELIPTIHSQFKLSINEPKHILKSYYSLLGINSRDEYG